MAPIPPLRGSDEGAGSSLPKRPPSTVSRPRAWMKSKDGELVTAGLSPPETTVGDRIYLDRGVPSCEVVSRIKAQALGSIKADLIADVDAITMGLSDVVSSAQGLDGRRLTRTVEVRFSHPSSVWNVLATGYGPTVERHAMTDAMEAGRKLGLSARLVQRGHPIRKKLQAAGACRGPLRATRQRPAHARRYDLRRFHG